VPSGCHPLRLLRARASRRAPGGGVRRTRRSASATTSSGWRNGWWPCSRRRGLDGFHRLLEGRRGVAERWDAVRGPGQGRSMSLRIRTMARLTGVREATLRAWERRYGFPRPARAENKLPGVLAGRAGGGAAGGAAPPGGLLRLRGHRAGPPRSGRRAAHGRPAAGALLVRGGGPGRARSGQGPRRRLGGDDAAGALRWWSSCTPARDGGPAGRGPRAPRLGAGSAAAPGARPGARSDDGPRAVLACPAGEIHEGGLLAIGVHLRHLGWRLACWGRTRPWTRLPPGRGHWRRTW
jgi:hypothetical protein